MQFIATSHSPQIIGELQPEEVIILKPGKPEHPGESFGHDTNYILEHILDAPERNPDTEDKLSAVRQLIDDEEYEKAQEKIDELRGSIPSSLDLQRAEALLDRITLVGA